jgi:hypothetical protein
MASAKCLNEGVATLIIGVFNTFGDLLITILPIPLFWRLQMPLKDRIAICLLLGLGIIVTIAGALRNFFIWYALISTYDETWYTYPLWICSAIEIDLAVVSIISHRISPPPCDF